MYIHLHKISSAPTYPILPHIQIHSFIHTSKFISFLQSHLHPSTFIHISIQSQWTIHNTHSPKRTHLKHTIYMPVYPLVTYKKVIYSTPITYTPFPITTQWSYRHTFTQSYAQYTVHTTLNDIHTNLWSLTNILYIQLLMIKIQLFGPWIILYIKLLMIYIQLCGP